MTTDLAQSRELALLATSVSPLPSPEAFAKGVTETVDWELLLRLAERHRVFPALARAVAVDTAVVPPEIGTFLAEKAQRSAFDELRAAATLGEITKLFEAEGIESAVLKGVPLSLMLHGRLGLRTSRDIDLLVPPERAWDAMQLLRSIGFRTKAAGEDIGSKAALQRFMRSHKDVELVNDERQLIVELHWRLFDNPCLLPLTQWPQCDRVDLPGGACRVLPQRLNLVYLANHGAQHAWSRLKWLADFAGLVASIGPDETARLYDETGRADGRRALAQALLLCETLLGMTAPEIVRREAEKDWRTRTLHSLALHCLTTGAERELEATRFGTTAKNMSHYLLSGSPRYWFREALFDLTDLSALPSGSPWRRWGAVGRLGEWLERKRQT